MATASFTSPQPGQSDGSLKSARESVIDTTVAEILQRLKNPDRIVGTSVVIGRIIPGAKPVPEGGWVVVKAEHQIFAEDRKGESIVSPDVQGYAANIEFCRRAAQKDDSQARAALEKCVMTQLEMDASRGVLLPVEQLKAWVTHQNLDAPAVHRCVKMVEVQVRDFVKTVRSDEGRFWRATSARTYLSIAENCDEPHLVFQELRRRVVKGVDHIMGNIGSLETNRARKSRPSLQLVLDLISAISEQFNPQNDFNDALNADELIVNYRKRLTERFSRPTPKPMTGSAYPTPRGK